MNYPVSSSFSRAVYAQAGEGVLVVDPLIHTLVIVSCVYQQLC